MISSYLINLSITGDSGMVNNILVSDKCSEVKEILSQDLSHMFLFVFVLCQGGSHKLEQGFPSMTVEFLINLISFEFFNRSE